MTHYSKRRREKKSRLRALAEQNSRGQFWGMSRKQRLAKLDELSR